MNRLVVSLSTVIITVALPLACSADVTAVLTGDVRVAGELDEPNGGLVGDENGGFTSLVVGINGGLVQNWALMGFDTTMGQLPGEVVISAELTINVQTGFDGGANSGSPTDTFSIHSLYSGNAGWVEGTGAITGTAAMAPEGVVTFIQQAYGNTTAGTNWVDGSGADVADFQGAYDSSTAINSNTVNGWNTGSAPTSITFEITDVALIQSWLDNGFADIVLQVNDGDGMNTTRFNLSNGSAQLTVFTETFGTIDRIDYEENPLAHSYNPDFGTLRFIEQPTEFVLSSGEVVEHFGAGLTIVRGRQLVSVSESGGNIIYEFEPEPGEEMMVYAVDLFSLFPEEYSTSGRFDEIGPLQLIAEPGSTVATMNGEVLVLEYDRQDNFDPIFPRVPYSVPFRTVVPFSLEFTIENSTWELDTFDNPFAYGLVGQIDLSAGVLVGDVNCDGVINLLDVAPFVDAITAGVFNAKADINQDGVVNLLDVAPFVALLTGG